MSAITAKASRKMNKYAVLTREPRCFLGSFDFSWEQRKFDEVFDCTVPNNTLSRAELSYDEGTVLNVHYGDVLIKYGSVLDVQKDDIPRIPHRCREDFNGALLQDGDVIIADTAEDETTGKACEIGNLQGSAIVSGLHTMVCRPRNRMALGYLGYYLNSNAYHHQLLPLMQGIKVLSLSRSNIQKTSVSYPIAVKEQQLIAYYFSQLDNLITLHQRKCVFLFSFFRACISMNFTASTFSWEQRKAKELFVSTADKGYPELPVLSATQDRGMIRRDENSINIFHDKKNEAGYKRVLPGQFVIHLRSFQGGFAHSAIEGITSPAYTVFGFSEPEKHDSEYWKYVFTSKSFIRRLETVTYGIRDGRSISYDEFLTLGFVYPSKAEQTAIARYLDKLSDLITLHQRECISFTGSAGRLILTANKKRITSSWEQRKLSEMCGTFEYGLNAAAKEFDGNNKYIRITDIDDASREFLLSDLSSPDICLDGMSKYLLSSGDIVFARTGASVGKTYIYRENDGIVYFAGFLIRAKVNQDNDAEFVFQSTLSPSYEKYIRITSQRSGQPGVNAQEYGEYDLFAPSKEEQQRIGHFLRGIDNLITLHQRKPFLMKWRTSDANRNQTNRLVL